LATLELAAFNWLHEEKLQGPSFPVLKDKHSQGGVRGKPGCVAIVLSNRGAKKKSVNKTLRQYFTGDIGTCL
jgi:hypothetical protein